MYYRSMDETQRLFEAHSAICAIGAEKALPYLTAMVRAQDGPIRDWMITQSEKWDKYGFEFKRDEDLHQLGIAGFAALQYKAQPAIPELTRLLSDTNHALTALECLIFIGESAAEPVCSCLTNRNPHLSAYSAQNLHWVVRNNEVRLAYLKKCLSDPRGVVRSGALTGIAMDTNAFELAIPLLITGLNDSDNEVSASAARALCEFSANSLRAFGALSNVVENRGSYATQASFEAMIKIAPMQTLPIVLEHLHSQDDWRRRQAVRLLCDYPVNSSEIQSAIERATEDPDQVVSERAKAFIVRKQRALQGR